MTNGMYFSPDGSLLAVAGFHEVLDLDRLRLLQGRRAEVVLRQRDEAALLVFVAFDEVFPGDRLAFALAHPFVADGRFVGGMQQAEAGPAVAHRGVQFDGDVDEAEREGTLPD